VARGAGDLAVAAEAGVEEQLLAQRRGLLVVSDLVRGIGRERRQAANPQLTERGDLVLAPLRSWPEQEGGSGGNDDCNASETDQNAL
jgi:hypothetical protein